MARRSLIDRLEEALAEYVEGRLLDDPDVLLEVAQEGRTPRSGITAHVRHLIAEARRGEDEDAVDLILRELDLTTEGIESFVDFPRLEAAAQREAKRQGTTL